MVLGTVVDGLVPVHTVLQTTVVRSTVHDGSELNAGPSEGFPSVVTVGEDVVSFAFVSSHPRTRSQCVGRSSPDLRCESAPGETTKIVLKKS